MGVLLELSQSAYTDLRVYYNFSLIILVIYV